MSILRRRITIAAALLLGAGVAAGAVWVVKLARESAAWFDRLPVAPSRVYARSSVLRPGMDPVAADVSTQLARAGYRLVKGPDVAIGEFAVAPGEWRIGLRQFRHAHGEERGGLLRVELDAEGRIARLRDAADRHVARAMIEPASIGAVLGSDRR